MKHFITIIALVLTTITGAAAQGNNTITVKTSKVSRQLVESWIIAYKAVRPDVNIVIVEKTEDANLAIINNKVAPGDDISQNVINVARYALLPVTSTENPLLAEIKKKQWNSKELKKVFFQTDDDLLAEDADKSKKEKLADKLTVYSGNNKQGSAEVFAEHFGMSKSDLKGKRIAGDDLYLLNAIQNEKQAVTFNNLAYLYDTKTRSLKVNLAILPLSLKKNQTEIISSGNLDNTLDLLETESIDEIPVAKIGFSYPLFNTNIDDFLSWVISDGQQYNHEAGFLRLNTNEAKLQLKLLAER